MIADRTHRQILALFLATLVTLALAACGGGLDAKAEPRPAASFAAADAASRSDGCGTAERPCVLQEIRVAAPAVAE
ncbi:MAG TPA: hypothetical protein VF615_01425 [Longimicrobiaceae bacterium]|jgi:hypothetical protein